ncbi:MAG: ribosome maturation factor RimM [Myxococcota bacterium]
MTDADAASGERWVLVGHVARPHGVRGGLKFELENPDSALLVVGLKVRLQRRGGAAKDATIRRVYGGTNVELEECVDRNAAEGLRGVEIFVRRDDFPPVDDDETYLVDLIGARVTHRDGHELGVIEAFSDNGAQPLAEVRTSGARDIVLVPFVPPIVHAVDESARWVVLAPPTGLFDDDAEEVPPAGGTS